MASYTWPAEGGGGGGGGGTAMAAGTVGISSGVSSISVTYDVTLSSPIPPLFSFSNTVDANPIFLDGIVTAFNDTGFTVKFNAQTDTANYKLTYAVMEAT